MKIESIEKLKAIVPGLYNVTMNTTGGKYHHNMNGVVHVESAEDMQEVIEAMKAQTKSEFPKGLKIHSEFKIESIDKDSPVGFITSKMDSIIDSTLPAEYGNLKQKQAAWSKMLTDLDIEYQDDFNRKIQLFADQIEIKPAMLIKSIIAYNKLKDILELQTA